MAATTNSEFAIVAGGEKIADHNQTADNFTGMLGQSISQLHSDTSSQTSFSQEMRRFLPPEVAKRTVENDQFWQYLSATVAQEGRRVLMHLVKQDSSDDQFRM